VLLLLLAIGTGYDLWRAWRPPARHSPPPLPPDPTPTATRDTAAQRREPADTAVLDLNRAGAAELDALPGIGPVLARRIVEFRRQHGPFRRVEELRAVRGVGPRLLERLKPRVSVGGIPPAAP
jgi:competence protein ComEA